MSITGIQGYFPSAYGAASTPRQPRLTGMGKVPHPPRTSRSTGDAVADAFAEYGNASSNAAKSQPGFGQSSKTN